LLWRKLASGAVESNQPFKAITPFVHPEFGLSNDGRLPIPVDGITV
jgi:hypothetical protein